MGLQAYHSVGVREYVQQLSLPTLQLPVAALNSPTVDSVGTAEVRAATAARTRESLAIIVKDVED
jgi:hypothetical protein